MTRRSATSGDRVPAPIVRRNLGSDVYGVIWDRLISRELKPGAKLSDLHLSQELGVSRTPVREALHRLVQDGVVVYAPNRGFFVASFSAQDVREIFDLRAVLETLALRTLLPRVEPGAFQWAHDELDRVDSLISSAESEAEANAAAAAFLEVDQGFHQWLIEGSGNRRLIAIANGLWGQISVFQRAGTHVPGWMEIAIRQHREIIEHLMAGDTEAATRALEYHILDMKARTLVDIAPSLVQEDDEGPVPT